MKDEKVCKGCKYRFPDRFGYVDLRKACDYAERTGQSRLKIEMENGGYKTDSCPCYQRGERGRGKRVEIAI